MSTTAINRWTELASRQTDGLAISLLWNKSEDHVKVAVVDERLDERFEFDVAGVDALAAFTHPFAFARSQSFGFADVVRDSLDLHPQV